MTYNNTDEHWNEVKKEIPRQWQPDKGNKTMTLFFMHNVWLTGRPSAVSMRLRRNCFSFPSALQQRPMYK